MKYFPHTPGEASPEALSPLSVMPPVSRETTASSLAPGLLPGLAIALCAVAAAVVLFFGASPGPRAAAAQAPEVTVPSRPADAPVRLGLIEFNYSLYNAREIDATIERLRQALAPRTLHVRRMRAEELDAEVRAGNIDFFVASAGFYWRMIPYGARSIASVVNASKPDPNRSDGAVFVVPAESSARSLADLKGLTLAASYPTAFIGYRTAMAEIAEKGYDYERFFSRTIFTGSPHIHTLVHALDAGQADVTIIPACTWEEMPEADRARYRLIGVRRDAGMRCFTSTPAYPGHTMAVMNGVSPEVAKTVTETLLSMKGRPNAESWSVATDFTPVDRAYRLLRIGPYAYLRDKSLRHWVQENRTAILLVLLAIAGLAFHAWRSEALVLRRTRELRDEERARTEALRELEGMNQRMERMHRANIVGQLSSMISHELAQPLAAIRYYCEGEKELLADPAGNAAMLLRCNAKAASQVDRAIAIVAKVRSYAKAGARREDRVDLSATLKSVLAELSVKGIGRVRVEKRMPPALFVKGDALELELLLWNLLKNATEAALAAPAPSIMIVGREEEGRAFLRIENSGAALTDDDLQRLVSPLSSAKAGGLGLGVSIVRSIAESTGGGIAFEARAAGGLSALVRLPLWSAGEQERQEVWEEPRVRANPSDDRAASGQRKEAKES